MWNKLRNRRLAGLKFRRQVGVGKYIVDFYCASARVAVEIDGVTHSSKEEREYDRHRQDVIEAYGIRVIRFWNSEVYHSLDRVLGRIVEVCRKRIVPARGASPRPSPPLGGEGARAGDIVALEEDFDSG